MPSGPIARAKLLRRVLAVLIYVLIIAGLAVAGATVLVLVLIGLFIPPLGWFMEKQFEGVAEQEEPKDPDEARAGDLIVTLLLAAIAGASAGFLVAAVLDTVDLGTWRGAWAWIGGLLLGGALLVTTPLFLWLRRTPADLRKDLAGCARAMFGCLPLLPLFAVLVLVPLVPYLLWMTGDIPAEQALAYTVVVGWPALLVAVRRLLRRPPLKRPWAATAVVFRRAGRRADTRAAGGERLHDRVRVPRADPRRDLVPPQGPGGAARRGGWDVKWSHVGERRGN